MLLGDRCNIFVCGVCNGGSPEFLAQLEIKFPLALYLAMWQLGHGSQTEKRRAVGYSVEDDIVPLLQKHLGVLCLNSKVDTTTSIGYGNLWVQGLISSIWRLVGVAAVMA
jgi:hypothetical protein